MKMEQIEKVRIESMRHLGFGPQVMKRLKICGNCGEPVPADKLFCRECGAPLPKMTLYQSYSARHKVCQACSIVVSDSSLYCPQCGGIIL
ncbi:MAG: zinc ribbon domain-containing protein [Firmicutes bacterium]|nr:zinc ribbon domain-containing protein [Bacillota bacterium]